MTVGRGTASTASARPGRGQRQQHRDRKGRGQRDPEGQAEGDAEEAEHGGLDNRRRQNAYRRPTNRPHQLRLPHPRARDHGHRRVDRQGGHDHHNHGECREQEEVLAAGREVVVAKRLHMRGGAHASGERSGRAHLPRGCAGGLPLDDCFVVRNEPGAADEQLRGARRDPPDDRHLHLLSAEEEGLHQPHRQLLPGSITKRSARLSSG